MPEAYPHGTSSSTAPQTHHEGQNQISQGTKIEDSGEPTPLWPKQECLISCSHSEQIIFPRIHTCLRDTNVKYEVLNLNMFTCPVDVPTAMVKAPLNFKAEIVGKLFILKGKIFMLHIYMVKLSK